jgi:hypothetical protein
MTYTAPDSREFALKAGTLSQKLSTEFNLIEDEFDENNSKFVVLTAGVGTNTALATTGIDLASGTDIDIYGVFVAPVDITVVSMKDYLTEAYVKDTADAKIEIYDDAGTPVKIFGRTLTAEGEDAKTFTSTEPETGKESIDAGSRLDLTAVNTGSSSGTGHAIVILEYVEA